SIDKTISIELEGVALRTVLAQILRPLGVTWMVRDDVIVITTEQQARGRLVTKTYMVADLIDAFYRRQKDQGNEPVRGNAWDLAVQAMTRQIHEKIAPRTWSENGGTGTIDYFPLGQVYVVNQTADVHEQLAEFFETLRAQAEQKATSETPAL